MLWWCVDKMISECGKIYVCHLLLLMPHCLFASLVGSSPLREDLKFTDEDNADVVFKLFVQNMEAQLSCPTNPQHISIEWLKDGQPFVRRPLGQIIKRDYWMKLPGLLVVYDKANYTCVVKTRLGQLKRTFIVNVIIQPRGPAELMVIPENQTVFEGETAELNCHYMNGDAAYVEWVKHYTVNGSCTSNDGTFYLKSVQNGSSIELDCWRLTIYNATESDSGWYTCIVSNIFGSARRGAWLKVNPLPVSQLAISSSSSYDLRTFVSTIVGVIVVLVAMAAVAMVIVWKRSKRRPALISFVESSLYRPVNLAVPEDPEWEIAEDHLQVGELIGEGAFGRVHLGHVIRTPNKSDPMVVAVKMLKEGATAVEVQDLIWEMETLKSIGRHVNIINFVGYCVPNEVSLMVVVEFAPYGNLREYLWKHCPSELRTSSDDYLTAAHSVDRPLVAKDLVLFAYQVARGMEYLASRKIVHRDLAARNVLVAEDHVLKIADFGLTREIKEKEYYRRTSNGRMPVKWMALESLIQNFYTTKTDVWSYGVLLWEIFSFGSNPYPSVPAESLLQVLQQGDRMEKPQYACSEVYSVMLRCWQRNPADRPDFHELVELFDQLVVQSADLHYLNLETAFDDSVFHESLEEEEGEGGEEFDVLTRSQVAITTIHSQPHGSDSLCASMSSQHTLSPAHSGNLCDQASGQEA